MSISAVSSHAYGLMDSSRTAEKQSIQAETSLAALLGKSSPKATRLSALESDVAGQNVPTSASLLAAQEQKSETSSGIRIPVGSLTLLNMSGIKATPIWELPEEEYQRALAAAENMFKYQYQSEPAMPDLSNYQPVKPYATVVVNGKVVAELDNQGCMTTSNELYSRLQDKIPNDVNGKNGPVLAQARAEIVAQMLGGSIVKADTAMTQMAFNGYPSLEIPEPVIDYETMMKDPLYLNLQKVKEQRAAYLAG